MTAGRTTAERRPVLRVPAIAGIAGVFGLFYAYGIWSALALLIAQATGPFGLNGLGWFLLIFAVLFPALAFAGAFALGWRRRALPFALILLTGLGVVAAFWINVLSYAVAYGASLIGA